MYPPCLLFIEHLLSDLRIRVAHALKSAGFAQTEIAHHLNVSQAMVSKYLARKVELCEEMDEVSSELARMIIGRKDQQDILLYLCQTCFRWREGGKTCTLHSLPHCTVCTHLRSPDILDEKRTVVQTIKEALAILEDVPQVVKLMPEVRMNIAMSLENASTPIEVAAVPGRLIPLHGRVTAVSDPEFGASHHLASILLKTENNAVINIKYDDKIRSCLDVLGFSLTISWDESADVLIDEGSFGIEPCAYIFGRDAVDAALKVTKIAELL